MFCLYIEREREEEKRRGILYCWWCCFLVSPSSRGQKEDAHKWFLLARFVFPSQNSCFSPPRSLFLSSCFRSSCSSLMQCLTSSPRVQTRMDDFSSFFFKLEELELWVPWMLPWDKVHMFLWQGTFRRTATTFTKIHHGVVRPFITHKK